MSYRKTGGRFRVFHGKYGCACPPAKAVRAKANAAAGNRCRLKRRNIRETDL